MKHLKKFNESIYTKEFFDFVKYINKPGFYEYGHIKGFEKSNKLNLFYSIENFIKEKFKGCKFESLFDDKIFLINLKDNKSITISEFEDEWFCVYLQDNDIGTLIAVYTCDQVSGLKLLLTDLSEIFLDYGLIDE
jgi:hypothetical protein